MSDHEHRFVWDNLHAYALGALDPEECRRVERHLRGCVLCQQELVIWTEVTHRLAFAVPLLDPPLRLRRLVYIQAQATASAPPPAPSPKTSRWRETIARLDVSRFWQHPPAMLAAVVLLLGLLGWNLHLHRQVGALRNDAAAVTELGSIVMAYMEDPNTVEHYTIVSPEGARAHLLYASRANRLALIAEGLPLRDNDPTFYVWLRDGTGQMLLATVLRCDPTGRAAVVFEPPIPLDNVVEILIVPARASNPGHPVLNGRLERREGWPVFLAALSS